MYDLTDFTMSDMTLCGRQLRKLGESTTSMDEAAGAIVRFLYDNLRDGAGGEKALVLARFFKTHPLGELPSNLREFARGVVPEDQSLSPDTRCLVLMGTVGQHSDWSDRRASSGHQAIPLTSEELVLKFPMISNLVIQFGLEPAAVVRPDPSCLQDLEERTFNVFLVENALGSPYIPAQEEFVAACGVRSVLGFGGLLPSGELFATIMFSRVAITKETAQLFRPLALCVKTSVLQHDGACLFS